jgi:D-alanyl-D-alanine carboxypeptidase
MFGNAPKRTPGRRARSIVLTALAVASATLIGVVAGPTAGPSKADGLVSEPVTVFTSDHPAVTNLDPGLLDALHRAARDAARDGVEIVVKSGWRSSKYQEQLFHEAASKYGSEEEAARWVAAANTSLHVSGDAVDIGRSNAIAWLSRHGATYGLCRIYRNEPWHYELRPKAMARGCPSMYANPARDPRMQQ